VLNPKDGKNLSVKSLKKNMKEQENLFVKSIDKKLTI
jgi:hypothetical protein